MNQSNFADIEYSKQLKNDFPNSECWWGFANGEYQIYPNKLFKGNEDGSREYIEDCYPALTTDMLLEKFKGEIDEYELRMSKLDDEGIWVVYYETYDKNGDCHYLGQQEYESKKLCNALAKMLIWLKKEGLLNG